MEVKAEKQLGKLRLERESAREGSSAVGASADDR